MSRRRAWTEEARSFAAVLGGLWVTGLALGHGWVGLLLAPPVFGLWLLSKLHRTLRWLEEGPRDSPPGFGGICGYLVDLAYAERRAEAQARRRLEEGIEQRDALVHALPDGVVMLDAGLRIERANAAAARLLGIRESVDQGRPVDNLVRHPRFVRYLRAGEFARAVTIPSPVIADRVLMVQLVPCAESQSLLIAWDETDSVRIDRMRRDFISNVSHELKTPLTVLQGYLETMSEAIDAIPERWRRPVAAMSEQVERMRRLTEDLLLLSRIESMDAPAQSAVVPVAELVAELVEEARALSAAREHRITAEAEPERCILGSRSELRTAFSNLVANAVRYTPAGGAVHIAWHGGCFEVTDTGVGIDRADIPRLTERFYRVDAARSPGEGGTGLGLAIVKHVLQHHNATLSVESTLGKGSRFTCRFPAERLVRPEHAPGARRRA